jgi:hypothetical protein
MLGRMAGKTMVEMIGESRNPDVGINVTTEFRKSLKYIFVINEKGSSELKNNFKFGLKG